MSQYLSISLKKKGKKNVKINLWWAYTTPARILEFIDAFPYTEEDVLLSKETYFGYLENIKAHINEIKERREKYVSKMTSLDTKLSLASNKDAYDAIKKDIPDCKSLIKDYDDDIAEYTNYVNELHHVWTIYDDNSKEWDLYYSNC